MPDEPETGDQHGQPEADFDFDANLLATAKLTTRAKSLVDLMIAFECSPSDSFVVLCLAYAEIVRLTVDDDDADIVIDKAPEVIRAGLGTMRLWALADETVAEGEEP